MKILCFECSRVNSINAGSPLLIIHNKGQHDFHAGDAIEFANE